MGLNNLSFLVLLLVSCNSSESQNSFSMPSSNVESKSSEVKVQLELKAKFNDIKEPALVESKEMSLGVPEFYSKFAHLCGKESQKLAAVLFEKKDEMEASIECKGPVLQSAFTEALEIEFQATGFLRVQKRYETKSLQPKFAWLRPWRFLGDCKNPYGRSDEAGLIYKDVACIELINSEKTEGQFFQVSVEYLEKMLVKLAPLNPEGDFTEAITIDASDESLVKNGEYSLIRWVDTTQVSFDRIDFGFPSDREDLATVLRLDTPLWAAFQCDKAGKSSEDKDAACRVHFIIDGFTSFYIYATDIVPLEDKKRYRLYFDSSTSYADFQI